MWSAHHIFSITTPLRNGHHFPPILRRRNLAPRLQALGSASLPLLNGFPRPHPNSARPHLSSSLPRCPLVPPPPPVPPGSSRDSCRALQLGDPAPEIRASSPLLGKSLRREPSPLEPRPARAFRHRERTPGAACRWRKRMSLKERRRGGARARIDILPAQ